MDRSLVVPRLVGWLAFFSAGLAAGALWAAETLAERRARVEKMSPAEKEQLLRRHDRFVHLPPAEQDQLRRLNRELEQDPDAPRLRQTMQRYYEWLKTLAPYQRMELTQLPAEKRVERVKKLLQEQADTPAKRRVAKEPPRVEAIKRLVQEQAKRLGKQLEPQDIEGLFVWAAQMADRQAARLLESLPEPRRQEAQQQLDSVRDPRRRRQVFGWLWMQWQAANPGKVPPLAAKDLAELRRLLSKSTQQRLEAMTTEQQWRIVSEWIGLLIQQERPLARRPEELISQETEEELALFFEHVLSEEEKDRLLSLPGDQMLRELWREYARSKLLRTPAWPAEHAGLGRRAGTWQGQRWQPKPGKAQLTSPPDAAPPKPVASPSPQPPAKPAKNSNP